MTIVVGTPDVAAVTTTLVDAGRTAYVAAQGDAVVVYDQSCDSQDPEEIIALGAELSRRHACASVGVLLHDSDILWYTLHVRGEEVDRYDSWPGYFEGEGTGPEGGDAVALCRAFDRPDAIDAVERVLRGDRAEMMDGYRRHEQLVEALGLPIASVGKGFSRIAMGGASRTLAAALVTVGGAPAPGTAEPAPYQLPPEPLVRALPPLSSIVGSAPTTMSDIFAAIIVHVQAHLGFDTDRITFACDDALRSVFGAERFRLTEVSPRLLALVEPVD